MDGRYRVVVGKVVAPATVDPPGAPPRGLAAGALAVAHAGAIVNVCTTGNAWLLPPPSPNAEPGDFYVVTSAESLAELVAAGTVSLIGPR